MEEAKLRLNHIKENILMYCNDEYETCIDADALIIITEWNQFRSLELTNKIKSTMRGNYFFDLRNIYASKFVLKKGFKYIAVGR